MDDLLTAIWSNNLYRKLILSGLVLVLNALLSQGILRFALARFPDDSPLFYTVRKATGYFITILTAILLFAIWVQRLGDLTVALGILAAGLAFALQEVIGSIAGWLTILSGRPFTIGDRIETGGIRGDVVDVGVLRTTVMEIGNWLHGDHNNGRIVTLSNAFIFKEPLYNYSAHLRYVWDEVLVPVTYESNWQRAVEIMQEAAKEHPAYQELLPKAEQQRRAARRKLAVRLTSLEPRTFIKLTDNWIELGVVYPVDTDLRRKFRSEISQRMLREFEAEGSRSHPRRSLSFSFPLAESPTRT
jgi:small-conductance mechanosensitive channel